LASSCHWSVPASSTPIPPRTIRRAPSCDHASDGSVGLGNIDPALGSAETIEHFVATRDRLAPVVKGLDAANHHRVVEAMDAALPEFLEAKAAIDGMRRPHGATVGHGRARLGGAVVDRLRFNAWIGILPPNEARPRRKWFDQVFARRRSRSASTAPIKAVRELSHDELRRRQC
jgi:muconate cycloisomerase